MVRNYNLNICISNPDKRLHFFYTKIIVTLVPYQGNSIFPEASQKYLNNLEILNTVTEIDARNKVTLKCNIKPS